MPTFQELVHDVYSELNQLRTDPQRFADRMRDLLVQVKDNKAMHRPQAVPVMTREGRNAVQEAIDAVRALEALEGLSVSKGLERAAQVHVNDTGSKGIIGHIGSDESTLQDRLERYGRWSDSIAEALDYGSMSGFEVVCAFLVDDGLQTRPHRNAILNRRFHAVGVGVGPHSEYKVVVAVVLAGEFEDKDESLPVVEVPEGEIAGTPEVENWMEGAVKMTCEIRTETEGDKVIKRIKKYWEMTDGSTQITEDTITLPKSD